MVGLLGHDDPLVVWTALALLTGRHLPDDLVSLGVTRLLEMPDVDDRVLVRFLRGRALPGKVALTLQSWLAAAPRARWPIALKLDWPPELTTDLAVNVRAIAAATAVEDTLAFDGLVAGTAERWLRGAG